MSTAAKRAPDYDLKDAALLDLLDKHHEELRFAKFSPEIGKLYPQSLAHRRALTHCCLLR